MCWPAASAASEGTVEELLNENWNPKLVPLQFYDDPTPPPPPTAEATPTPPKIGTSAKPTTPNETSWKSIVGVLLAVVIIAVVIAVIVCWCCRCPPKCSSELVRRFDQIPSLGRLLAPYTPFVRSFMLWAGLAVNSAFVLYDTQLIVERCLRGGNDYI
ncbi:hypothetical protein niasHS_010453 [Heterodera schachtii]|uniref:Uncharacterized protein n=1 Tax=Heterodera schachtii TaxID=97005 RepID=A0ABD2IZT7_HETSC